MKKLLILLTLTLFLISCGNKSENNKADTSVNVSQGENMSKEILVTSIPPLKWLVQKIAGNDFEVISIIQPNMNHELFEPKPNDLKILENSKLFFTYNALNFETEISKTLNREKVSNLLENVDKALLLENDHEHDDSEHGHKHSDGKDSVEDEHGHDHGEFDPHVWFSLDLMPLAAENIKKELIETYPDKKDIFEKNYTIFLNELESFKKEASEKMNSKTKEYFMIYHPALNYFLKNYRIKEVAVEYQGKEPSAKQIKEIIEEAKEHNISTILVQPQFPKESIEAISKEIPNSKIVEFNTDEEDVFQNLRKFIDSLE